jgi:tetratricopeptide (TPR) repeat protein
MKTMFTTFAFAFAMTTASVFAGENFSDSIQKGDAQRSSSSFANALSEFDQAYSQAANDTERSIALSKKAEVYAFNLKDYVKARAEAEKSLALAQAEAVGKVTAYQVLAECQLRKDLDPTAAALTLEQALALEGVDWARTGLLLTLGDCYRMTGRPEQAIAHFEQVIERTGADPTLQAVAYLNIGLTYQYALVNAAKATEAYGKASALNPGLKGEIDNHIAKLP